LISLTDSKTASYHRFFNYASFLILHPNSKSQADNFLAPGDSFPIVVSQDYNSMLHCWLKTTVQLFSEGWLSLPVSIAGSGISDCKKMATATKATRYFPMAGSWTPHVSMNMDAL